MSEDPGYKLRKEWHSTPKHVAATKFACDMDDVGELSTEEMSESAVKCQVTHKPLSLGRGSI